MLVDAIGIAAGLAVIAAFYAKCQIRLRLYALLSNALFVVYGVYVGLLPVVVLHLMLVPLNLGRLFMLVRDVAGFDGREIKWPTRRGISGGG